MKRQEVVLITLLSIIAVCLIGCSNNSKIGTLYENIKTKERIKIEFTGTEKEIYKHLKATYGGKKYFGIIFTGLPRETECFGFEIEINGLPYYKIKPIESLKNDYIKLSQD
jgi:hypothetical protein